MSKTHDYGLDSKPPLPVSMLVALQHLLAVFGGIITAPLIIATGMGLSIVDTSYFVSASLALSGLATLIQVNRLGPVGSGLLSIQGTSFTFIGPMITAYFMLVKGLSGPEALGVIFGTSFVCSLTIFVLAQGIERVQKFVTPNVTGTTVILIGISLIWSSIKNLLRELEETPLLSSSSLGIISLCLATFLVTLFVSRLKNAYARMLSITAGLCFGSVVAISLGLVDFSELNKLESTFIPDIGHFPLGFDIGLYLILIPIFVISSLETIGDLTATCDLSGIRINSKEHWRRLRGGISGDALNSAIASIFCSFPNTSFSQNNGVIRLTGVSSRYIGRFVAVYLILLGLFPMIGGIFIVIPNGVLIGATLLMFIMVLISGLAIVESNMVDSKRYWVVAFSVGGGWLISLVMNGNDALPDLLSSILSFPISTGTLLALLIEVTRKLVWLQVPEQPEAH